jgi:SAM-dependent methyltransferase
MDGGIAMIDITAHPLPETDPVITITPYHSDAPGEVRFSDADIRARVATLRAPERSRYPELDAYARHELYEDCSGGGGLYLAGRMARTLRLKPGDIVLDLGCGKGAATMFLARHFGVRVIGVDLWTPATDLDQKFTAHGYRDLIVPLHLDVTGELPFADNYFDAVFSMNSFSFYGDNLAFVRRLLRHVKPGGQLCIGGQVLTSEFTTEQLQNPPLVYSFQLPPPAEGVDVFTDDFRKHHTPGWWRDLFEASGLLRVEHCEMLDDADVLYEELVHDEYEYNTNPFDVAVSLAQIEWKRDHEPRMSLFVLTATKSRD